MSLAAEGLSGAKEASPRSHAVNRSSYPGYHAISKRCGGFVGYTLCRRLLAFTHSSESPDSRHFWIVFSFGMVTLVFRLGLL